MNFNTLFQRYTEACGKSYPLTPRNLQVDLDTLIDYPDEIAPWFSSLFTNEEFEYLCDYFSE